jgi:CheY-like chemotaxis protein
MTLSDSGPDSGSTSGPDSGPAPEPTPAEALRAAVAYYDAHAEAFHAQTADLDLEHVYASLPPLVPPGGAILDAGCGAGATPAAWPRAATAWRPSTPPRPWSAWRGPHAGVARARADFAAMDYPPRSTACWPTPRCCNLPPAALPGALAGVARALLPGGVLCAGLKRGAATWLRQGLPFWAHDEAALAALLAPPCPLRLLETWTSPDLRPGRAGEVWLHCLARKPVNQLGKSIGPLTRGLFVVSIPQGRPSATGTNPQQGLKAWAPPPRRKSSPSTTRTSSAKSIEAYLEDSGFAVIHAENGRVGLEAFRRERPDLVLVDLRMPEVDGLDVLAKVTSESPLTPIIVVSGTGVLQDAIEALRLGAWDYVTSPCKTWPCSNTPCPRPWNGPSCCAARDLQRRAGA